MWSTLILIIIIIGTVLGAWVWQATSRTRQSVERMPAIEGVSPRCWDALASKRVFFGHQSVGENILDGMREIVAESSGIQLRIQDISGSEVGSEPGFFHQKIGRNTRPKSKFNSFQKAIERNQENPFDIAVMKLCYVDIQRDSKPEEVFDQYQSAISDLEARFPNLVIVPATIPIESDNPNLKMTVVNLVKARVGRPWVADDNRARQRFNEMVRARYAGRQLVFDLARSEVVGANGSMRYRSIDSEDVFFMDGRYSDDGGHLNSLGRRHVAEQLLITLALIACGERFSEQSRPSCDN